MSLGTARRMRQFLVFRLLIVTIGFFLVTFYVTCLNPEVQQSTTVYLFSILSIYMVGGIISLLTYDNWKLDNRLLRVQLPADLGLQALLVWSTGGPLSLFSPLLFVTFVSATALASVRGALLLATAVTSLLIGNTLLYGIGVAPPWGASSSELDSSVTAYLCMSILGLYLLSVLGSRYSRGLYHAEHVQEEIVDNMAEGLLAVDRDGRVVRMNGELRRILGLDGPLEKLEGRPLREVLKKGPAFEGSNRTHEEILDVFLQGTRKCFETTFCDVRGRRMPVQVKMSAVSDDKGVLRCRIGLFSDLSLEREVESKERRIRQLEDMHDLAMRLAHEVRNPLASIRGCAQEIGRTVGGGGVSSRRRLAEIIVTESDRLDRILESFLRSGREAPPAPELVDLAALVGEAVLLLRRRTESVRRAIEYRPPEGEVLVRGDRQQLLQALLNLGINALQATEPGDGRVELEVCETGAIDGSCTASVERVEVHVRDNGTGIRPSDRDKVFRPLFTTKQEGSGLGLNVVERIVERHGGDVRLESSEGRGTHVVVVLERASRLERAPGVREASAETLLEVRCDA